MSAYLFIDGAYFREAYRSSMQRFFGAVPSINWPALQGQLGSVQRIYYYDAIDRGTVGAETPDGQQKRIKDADDFHAYLNTIPNWHVREGFTSRGRRAARRTQKAVDVQLAVDALEHAAAHNMSVAYFVFGDLDFEPLLFSLNRAGVQTVVWYELGTASEELLEAADVRQQLTLSIFHAMTVGSFNGSTACPSFGANSTKPAYGELRTGVWRGRPVHLLGSPSGTDRFLWADAGADAVREPAVYAHYVNTDEAKLALAFTMQYGGAIVWS
jgi:uncharacterized LabA/DUF88 family protein